MSGLFKSDVANPVLNWIDQRLPLITLMQKEYGVFPTPKNFNYFWNFGALAMINLMIMIITGVFLAMHYTPSTRNIAFASIQHIMRDVNYGWLLRYVAHANGATMFFIVVYIHIYPWPVLRLLQVAARTAVDAGRGAVPVADDGDGVHGLRSALGPDVLLGRDRHHEPVLARSRWVGDSNRDLAVGRLLAVGNPTLNAILQPALSAAVRASWASCSCTWSRCTSPAPTIRWGSRPKGPARYTAVSSLLHDQGQRWGCAYSFWCSRCLVFFAAELPGGSPTTTSPPTRCSTPPSHRAQNGTFLPYYAILRSVPSTS